MFINFIDIIVKRGETTYYPSNCLIMIINSSILTINGLIYFILQCYYIFSLPDAFGC